MASATALVVAHGLYPGSVEAQAGTNDVAASASSQSAAPERVPAAGTRDRTARNLVYLELLGNCFLYSVNYERFVSNNLAVRVGFEYVPPITLTGADDSTTIRLMALPLMLNYLGIGNVNHALVLGAGPLLIYSWENNTGRIGTGYDEGMALSATATIGYRYAPYDGGFAFNAGFTPVLIQGDFVPWAGAGGGVVF